MINSNHLTQINSEYETIIEFHISLKIEKACAAIADGLLNNKEMLKKMFIRQIGILNSLTEAKIFNTIQMLSIQERLNYNHCIRINSLMPLKTRKKNIANDFDKNSSCGVLHQAENNSEKDIETFRKILYRIWGLTEVLRNDVEYIKNIYTTSKGKNRKGVNKAERIAKLKHRLITSGRRNSDSNT